MYSIYFIDQSQEYPLYSNPLICHPIPTQLEIHFESKKMDFISDVSNFSALYGIYTNEFDWWSANERGEKLFLQMSLIDAVLMREEKN